MEEEPQVNRDEILKHASDIIGSGGARQADYGSWSHNAAKIAEGWSLILNTQIDPRHVGLMLAWMKIVRQIRAPHLDSSVDLAGYAALTGELDSNTRDVSANADVLED